MNESGSQAQPAALALANISKQFACVQALDKVDFTLAAGEIHALLGENGAGKSTLVKVMTGAYPLDAPFDTGTITLAGKTISPRSPADAQAAGISTVYQEVNLLPNLSVAHNLYLGREPKRFGLIHWRRLNADAAALLKRLGLDIDVRQPLSACSLAIRQLVAIARGLDLSARVLVLDEPTASLDRGEVELLFNILRELKARGMAIVFITHFLDQVYALADRITVLRNGTRVGTFITGELPRRELVAHMLGRELEALEEEAAAAEDSGAGELALQVTGLGAANGIHGVSFSARKGDVVGLSGLLGSGRTEVCESLFGLVPVTSGSIDIGNRRVHIGSPRDAIGDSLALCPEDRKAAGIVSELSIQENLILALQARRGWLKPIPRREQQRLAGQTVSDLRIACSRTEQPAGELSGGNQQKVVLGRWLATRPEILILDEPTRGIDIGAHAEIIRLVRRLCRQGMTVIVASSEIEELVAVCDKIVVMRDSTLRAELTGNQINEQAVMAAISQEH